MPFFQISLKNGEPQTTHNTFRVGRVHFFPHSRNSCIYKADSCFCLPVRGTRYANLIIILNFKPSLRTMGARDFSSAVSGFAALGFGLRPKTCRPSANTENSRRTREKPLVPRVFAKRGEQLIAGDKRSPQS